MDYQKHNTNPAPKPEEMASLGSKTMSSLSSASALAPFAFTVDQASTVEQGIKTPRAATDVNRVKGLDHAVRDQRNESRITAMEERSKTNNMEKPTVVVHVLQSNKMQPSVTADTKRGLGGERNNKSNNAMQASHTSQLQVKTVREETQWSNVVEELKLWQKQYDSKFASSKTLGDHHENEGSEKHGDKMVSTTFQTPTGNAT